MKAVKVMKNSSYWKKRFEILEESAVKKGADYYESLDKEYRKAQKAIDAKIKVWYQRFANNNEISLAEARKLLNSDELEEFKWNVEDYIKYGQENAFTQEWMKELENASAKMHISRLESLKLQMQQEVEVLYGNQLDGIDKLARDIYTDGYYRTAFEIQKGFNVGWDFHSIDSRRLEKVISKPWTADGKTFSDKLWTQKNDLISTLHTELTQGIMRGLAPDKAIKTISDKFKVAKSKAGRLVMTESAYFASASQKDCFKELDVEKFEIVATLDSHTSELCQSMDGVVQDMKDFQPGVTAPPFHPWCRSTTVPYFDDDEGYRAARGADGKTYYVPSNMTYGEWKNAMVDGKTDDLTVVDDDSKHGLAPDVSDTKPMPKTETYETIEDIDAELSRLEQRLATSNDFNEWIEIEEKQKVLEAEKSRLIKAKKEAESKKYVATVEEKLKEGYFIDAPDKFINLVDLNG
jgi:SPP1 gp7 family putative phage head morphogenesis protein